MAQNASKKSNEFVVSLGNVAIPNPIAGRIEEAIRNALLGIIADLDLTDDIIIRFPPELRGIYVDLSRVKNIGSLDLMNRNYR